MTPPARTLLHRRHRLALWERPLAIMLAALGADAVLAWFAVGMSARAAVLGVAVLAALAARFWFQPKLRDTARALDGKAGTHNRLEALAALEGRADPLAKAIEEETAAHLARHPLPRASRFLGGLSLLVALAVLDVAMQGRVQPRPLVADAAGADKPAAKIAEKAAEKIPATPAAAPEPSATLRWIEPMGYIVATAQEAVPLLAESNSSVALKNANLRLTAAGKPLAPQPPSGDIAAGVQEVPLTLDLAPLEAAPFSFVTYHLTAELARDKAAAAAPPRPAVASPLQVIQIRPLGSDLTAAAPPADEAAEDETERLLFCVKRLKIAQIDVLKGAFALGHNLPPRSDPAWAENLAAVTAQARTLWQDAKALVPAMEKNIAAAPALEPLRQAVAEAEKTWDALARPEPMPAFVAAERALAGFGEAERLLTGAVDLLRESADALKSAQAQQAGKDEAPLPLPPREETPAGKLEALARAQQELADALAKDSATDAFARQDKIARALPKLADDEGFPPAVAEAIKSAAADTREAAQHLNDRDARAAVEPATRAAQTLAAAVAALDALGRERAEQELAEAQRSLNEAAAHANSGEWPAAEAKAEAVRRDLNAEARAQQNYGSAEAAGQLAAMSDAVEPLSASSAEKLTELAERSAAARQALQGEERREEELAQAAEALRRAQANAERAAKEGDEALRDLFKQAQENAQKAGESLPFPPPENDRHKNPEAPDSEEGKAIMRALALQNHALLIEQKDVVSEAEKLGGQRPMLSPEEFGRRARELEEREHAVLRKLMEMAAPIAMFARAAEKPLRGARHAVGESEKALARKNPADAITPGKDAVEQFVEIERILTNPAASPAAVAGGQQSEGKTGRKVRVKTEQPGGPSDLDGGSKGTGGSPTIDNDPGNRQRYGRLLNEQISGVIAHLEQRQRNARRTQVLTTATPADAPPEYRPAVADYFESLARGNTSAPPAPPATPLPASK